MNIYPAMENKSVFIPEKKRQIRENVSCGEVLYVSETLEENGNCVFCTYTYKYYKQLKNSFNNRVKMAF